MGLLDSLCKCCAHLPKLQGRWVWPALQGVLSPACCRLCSSACRACGTLQPAVWLQSLQDEAFQLWETEWGKLYEPESESYKVLADIAATWFLVSVVDNDYVSGDLFKWFEEEAANGHA